MRKSTQKCIIEQNAFDRHRQASIKNAYSKLAELSAQTFTRQTASSCQANVIFKCFVNRADG